MEPTDDSLVDLVDVLLRDGAVLRADVVISVADVPLVGVTLSAAIAGMATMNEYGLLEEWDGSKRANAVARRQYTEDGLPRHRVMPQRGPGGHRGRNATKNLPRESTSVEREETTNAKRRRDDR